MPSVEAQLEKSGLQVLGVCGELDSQSQHWRHEAALIEDLTSAEAQALGVLMPLVRAEPGQVLIREGDLGDWMLLILSGTVDVTKAAEHGELSRLAVIKQGAAVGEMSMLDAGPRYATCTAIDTVEAGVLSRQCIAQLIRDHPSSAAKLLVKLTQLLAQRLRNTSNQLVRIIQKQ